MTKSEKKATISIIAVFIVITSWFVWINFTVSGRAIWNTWFGIVQKIDDKTNYKTKKQVEDTCRAMISSYESDRLTYEQYRGNDDKEKQRWADQAKMRANRTAATYNNYIIENSYVWQDNVPKDIRSELKYLK